MKYRKKPIVIEAQQLTADNASELAKWCGGVQKVMMNDRNPWGRRGLVGVTIQTLEGNMLAEFNDYIIKGVQGEFYPCKPDIFEASYEVVE